MAGSAGTEPETSGVEGKCTTGTPPLISYMQNFTPPVMVINVQEVGKTVNK